MLKIKSFQVEYEKEITKTDPMIEITLREIKNTPTYLQKGQAKRDFVCGDRYYYLYTDIGKNEVGEITINFLREFGNIWARVVRKDQNYADEDNLIEGPVELDVKRALNKFKKSIQKDNSEISELFFGEKLIKKNVLIVI